MYLINDKYEKNKDVLFHKHVVTTTLLLSGRVRRPEVFVSAMAVFLLLT